MNLQWTATIVFFLLFESKEFPTQAIRLENDVTKPMDKCFAKIFATDYKMPKKLLNPDFIEEFEYNINPALLNDVFYYPDGSHFHYKYAENKMQINFHKDQRIEINGTISTLRNETFASIREYTDLRFKNLKLVAIGSRLPKNSSTMNISFNFSYCDIYPWSYRMKKDAFSYNSNSNMAGKKGLEFSQELNPAFGLIFDKYVEHNSKSVQSVLEETFQNLSYTEIILKKHPDFFKNPQKFHYLITQVPFLRFTLKRIVIKGLWNLDSITVQCDYTIWTHSLNIKNIEGSVTLDYKHENETPLKMKFQIDHLYIRINREKNSTCAHAKYYNVTRAKTNTPLTFRQEEVIMNGLESAILSSIAPSMRITDFCELKNPVEEIKVANTSDWKSVKEAYKTWIPFNDDEVIDEKQSQKELLAEILKSHNIFT